MSVSATVRATTKAQTIDLAKLRGEVAESEKRAYGAKREYGSALNTMWAHFDKDWFDLNLNSDTSDNAKAAKAEREALYKVLRAAGHTNPSVAWGQIKDQARIAKYGAPSDSGSGVNTRDADTYAVEEATKYYASIHRRTNASAKSVRVANDMRASIKREYGVDIDKSDK